MSEACKEKLKDAPAATIFPFLIDADKFVLWMGTEARLEPAVGGEYFVLVAGKHPAVGEFVEVVPNEKVVFTMGWDEPNHPIPAGSTEVEITLTAQGAATMVRLVHRGLPDDAVTDHEGGWGFYLDRLQTVVDGGDPGPDSSHDDD